ncbi:MAG: DEAD/DEAH box helicase, partial [Cyanobacteria bacterium]|nr:DEAD/DEAH box helicase [Cyanobacteriota bacterium]
MCQYLKTIIAEYAASQAIERGVKMFYTTPLKALSNQKYFDLKNRYGEQNVGLLTGDLSLNREARIVVMTTEVFRNMLYGLNEDRSLLANIGYAVLDECHFMNDAERGTVWEESIIYCPPSIQLIALSATVANADELTNWIDEVHHNTKLIVSDVRPVPLRFSYYTRESLLPLFEAPGRMNKKLKLDLKGNKFSKTTKSFRPNLLIEEMFQKEMLPGIFFTFSRKGCDQYLRDTRTLRLLNAAEKEILNRKIEDFLVQNPFLESNPMLEYIRNGFASHHAGLLPGLKHLVESLFQQGLIKVVFATETLAAGINMPARSTVITAISKRTNEGHRLLTASEFLQMSGRAGRRGLDPVGYVVVVSSPFRGAQEAATLASSLADPLNSRFTPTYGMVLNLLQKFTVEEAKFLISKSFGQFTSERRLLPLKREIQ